jgi:hypothetical protein
MFLLSRVEDLAAKVPEVPPLPAMGVWLVTSGKNQQYHDHVSPIIVSPNESSWTFHPLDFPSLGKCRTWTMCPLIMCPDHGPHSGGGLSHHMSGLRPYSCNGWIVRERIAQGRVIRGRGTHRSRISVRRHVGRGRIDKHQNLKDC